MATNSKRNTSSKNRSTSSNKSQSSKGRTKGKKKEELLDSLQYKVYQDEIILIVSLVIAILLILSNFGLSGFFGVMINSVTFGMFGLMAYILPYILFIATAFFLSNKDNKKAKIKLFSTIILITLLTTFLELIVAKDISNAKIFDFYTTSSVNKSGGGILGGLLCKILVPLFGVQGSYVILMAISIILVMFITEKALFASLGKKGGQTVLSIKERNRLNRENRVNGENNMESSAREKTNKNIIGRAAKTFILKKMPEDSKDKRKSKGLESVAISGTPSFDMSEIIPEEINNIPISRAYPEKGMIDNSLDNNITPVYEEELKKKFSGKDNSYDIKELANEMINNSQEEREVNAIQKDIYIEKQGNESYNEFEQEKLDNEITDKYKSQTEISEQEESETEKLGIHELETEKQEVRDREIKEPKSKEEELQEIWEQQQAKLKTKDSAVETNEKITPMVTMAQQPLKTQQPPLKAQQPPLKVQQPPKEYKFPPINLLLKPTGDSKGIPDRELKETAMKLQKTLESFGVRVSITNVSCGPAVTRYELQPEQGVKVSRITNLADDIKLNLAAADIRIEAPIPGKAAVGIEVPNKENTTVMFRELIENPDFKKHSSNIAFAVGKDIGGKTIITDIGKMPHLLIAGATGSGKSVCINTLIMSILYKANPEDVKLIMIDPKVVELSVYNGIPHLLIPVVTDPKKASAALNWAVMEMTDRYNKFAEIGARDIKGYNEKIKTKDYCEDDKYKRLPQIVIIVDELADLMMVAPGEVEDAICRLAQMARAAGLHLIIATQRPSVNVITGLIKANIPSRIAFSVSSSIDSRTIIDGSGAEKLLGKGDMLFFPSGYPKPVRIQGAFISDKEVSDVVEYLSSQTNIPQYNQEIADKITNSQIAEADNSSKSDNDEYFVEAGNFIIDKDKASIGMLQRVYKIGFNRAARIMDQLCEAGVVGSEEGTKPRKVLMSSEEFAQYITGSDNE